MHRDEFEQRVRALSAERQRPAPDRGVGELLGDLIAALARLYTTPPDCGPTALPDRGDS